MSEGIDKADMFPSKREYIASSSFEPSIDAGMRERIRLGMILAGSQEETDLRNERLAIRKREGTREMRSKLSRSCLDVSSVIVE